MTLPSLSTARQCTMFRASEEIDTIYSGRITDSITQALVFEFMSVCERRKETMPEYIQPNNPINKNIAHDFLILLSEDWCQHRSVSFYADKLCVSSKYLSQGNSHAPWFSQHFLFRQIHQGTSWMQSYAVSFLWAVKCHSYNSHRIIMFFRRKRAKNSERFVGFQLFFISLQT